MGVERYALVSFCVWFFEFEIGLSERGADVAQLVEQPPCKRQVTGSSPVVGSSSWEGYPSGQREQTVNLPAFAYRGSNPLPSTKTA